MCVITFDLSSAFSDESRNLTTRFYTCVRYVSKVYHSRTEAISLILIHFEIFVKIVLGI